MKSKGLNIGQACSQSLRQSAVPPTITTGSPEMPKNKKPHLGELIADFDYNLASNKQRMHHKRGI